MAFFTFAGCETKGSSKGVWERGMLPGVGSIPGLYPRVHRWCVHQYATKWNFDFSFLLAFDRASSSLSSRLSTPRI